MYARLAAFYGGDTSNFDLPATVPLAPDVVDESFYVFSVLEAVEWKWTVNDVLEQPEALLENILTLASIARKVKGQIDEQKKKEEERKAQLAAPQN